MDSARELVKLYGQKFDLLQPDSAAAATAGSASEPSQATIKALEELKGVISNHLQASGRSTIKLCKSGIMID